MTVSIDFDGVIHAYRKGWDSGDIYDIPMKDSFYRIGCLLRMEPVFIHTSRNPSSVARWIEKESGHAIECTTRRPRNWYGTRKHFWDTTGLVLVTNFKYPARIYIDDRAYRFTDWEDSDLITSLFRR